MAGELVPELHDIGKLCSNQSIRENSGGKIRLKGHYFSTEEELRSWNLPVPETNTWIGIRFHNDPKAYDGSDSRLHVDLLLLNVADQLASATSRAYDSKLQKIQMPKGLKPKLKSPTRFVLWQGIFVDPPVVGWAIATNSTSLNELLTFLCGDPKWPEARDKYHRNWDCVPEAKEFPMHITSLKTHSELVGRIYKALKPSIITLDPVSKAVSYQIFELGSVKEAQGKWPFRLARCHVTFPQRPARTRDLGVFLRLQELMQEVEKSNHLLLHTLDTLWLFLPVEELLPLRDALEPFLYAGFTVEADVAERPLGELDSNIFTKHKEWLQPFYLQPEMPDKLPPHLCDLCQMRPAQEVPDEKSGIIEHLCDTCLGFRKLSKNRGSFTKLGGIWENEDIAVAWVRVRLDYKHLPEVLGNLFQQYLAEPLPGQKSDIPEEEIKTLIRELRHTALMVDFTEDYNKLLGNFYGSLIKQNMDNEGIIGEDRPELLAVALKEEGQALKIIDVFIEEFLKLFPKCEQDSPISLSVSISNAKYPFFEHWDYLGKDKSKEAINIQVVGRAPLELSIPQFKKLRGMKLEEQEKASSKLHRAAAVRARTGSEIMEKIEFLDDIKRYPVLHQAHMQDNFSVGELLAYQKIADIGGQP